MSVLDFGAAFLGGAAKTYGQMSMYQQMLGIREQRKQGLTMEDLFPKKGEPVDQWNKIQFALSDPKISSQLSSQQRKILRTQQEAIESRMATPSRDTYEAQRKRAVFRRKHTTEGTPSLLGYLPDFLQEGLTQFFGVPETIAEGAPLVASSAEAPWIQAPAFVTGQLGRGSPEWAAEDPVTRMPWAPEIQQQYDALAPPPTEEALMQGAREIQQEKTANEAQMVLSKNKGQLLKLMAGLGAIIDSDIPDARKTLRIKESLTLVGLPPALFAGYGVDDIKRVLAGARAQILAAPSIDALQQVIGRLRQGTATDRAVEVDQFFAEGKDQELTPTPAPVSSGEVAGASESLLSSQIPSLTEATSYTTTGPLSLQEQEKARSIFIGQYQEQRLEEFQQADPFFDRDAARKQIHEELLQKDPTIFDPIKPMAQLDFSNKAASPPQPSTVETVAVDPPPVAPPSLAPIEFREVPRHPVFEELEQVRVKLPDVKQRWEDAVKDVDVGLGNKEELGRLEKEFYRLRNIEGVLAVAGGALAALPAEAWGNSARVAGAILARVALSSYGTTPEGKQFIENLKTATKEGATVSGQSLVKQLEGIGKAIHGGEWLLPLSMVRSFSDGTYPQSQVTAITEAFRDVNKELVKNKPKLTVTKALHRDVQRGRAVSGLQFAEVYTVRFGDTLGKIAETYGISAEVLAAMNTIPEPDKIAIGQKLNIPAAGASAYSTAYPFLKNVFGRQQKDRDAKKLALRTLRDADPTGALTIPSTLSGRQALDRAREIAGLSEGAMVPAEALALLLQSGKVTPTQLLGLVKKGDIDSQADGGPERRQLLHDGVIRYLQKQPFSEHWESEAMRIATQGTLGLDTRRAQLDGLLLQAEEAGVPPSIYAAIERQRDAMQGQPKDKKVKEEALRAFADGTATTIQMQIIGKGEENFVNAALKSRRIPITVTKEGTDKIRTQIKEVARLTWRVTIHRKLLKSDEPSDSVLSAAGKGETQEKRNQLAITLFTKELLEKYNKAYLSPTSARDLATRILKMRGERENFRTY